MRFWSYFDSRRRVRKLQGGHSIPIAARNRYKNTQVICSVCSLMYTTVALCTLMIIRVSAFLYRLLPGKDLASAATVSKSWLKLCRYDRHVRNRIHSHLKLRRKYKMRNLLRSVRHTLSTTERAKPFSSVFNCIRQVSKHQRTAGK